MPFRAYTTIKAQFQDFWPSERKWCEHDALMFAAGGTTYEFVVTHTGDLYMVDQGHQTTHHQLRRTESMLSRVRTSKTGKKIKKSFY